MRHVAGQVGQQVISARFAHHALGLVRVVEGEIRRAGDHGVAGSS